MSEDKQKISIRQATNELLWTIRYADDLEWLNDWKNEIERSIHYEIRARLEYEHMNESEREETDRLFS